MVTVTNGAGSNLGQGGLRTFGDRVGDDGGSGGTRTVCVASARIPTTFAGAATRLWSTAIVATVARDGLVVNDDTATSTHLTGFTEGFQEAQAKLLACHLN